MFRLTANFALSADGKVAPRGHSGSGFGSPADHRRLLALRAAADAILVGHHTLVADSMTLGLGTGGHAENRLQSGKPGYPARCVAAFTRPIPADHRLIGSLGGPVHLFLGPGATGSYPGCRVHPLDSPADLLPVLRAAAAAEGWAHVHCEGGPSLLRHLLADGALDALHLTLTPKLFGGFSAPTLTRATLGPALPASLPFVLESMEEEDGDLFLTYAKR